VAIAGVVAFRGTAPARPDHAGAAPEGASPSPFPVPSAASARSRSTAPQPSRSAATSGGRPRLLFGMGTEASDARRTALVAQAPVKMLSSWYNGPGDLSWMTGWRTGTVPKSYAAGYALHLIVWTNDTEGPVDTAYGPACGRGYPLSRRFTGDMKTLAQTFAGSRTGPPLYVTMFTELQTYPCQDNAWSPDTATTNYYRALQDQYRAAYHTFHQYAPNARVSLGWGGWQASYDDPGSGGGRSLFGHFDSVLRMSDFQSFQAMSTTGNIENIKAMVGLLGRYGPVMIAHFKPDNGAQATFDADVRTMFTVGFLAAQTRAGLFALSFMDNTNLAASATTFAFVKSAVKRYGRSW
jgi:hypothetical protein